MDKKKILIIAAVILVAVVIYFAFIKKKKPAASSVPGNSQAGALTVSTVKFPLKKGSTGPEVMAVQKYLINKFGDVLPKFGADGIWAEETEAAVQTYLKRDNISANVYTEWGIASTNTAAFLGYNS